MSEQIEIEERELVVSATAMLRDAYWFGGSAALATTFGGLRSLLPWCATAWRR